MNTKTTLLFAATLGCLLLAGQPSHAEDSVATLVGNLASADETVQLRAIDELGAQKEKAAEAVTPLVQLLKSPSAKVRAHAAHSLGEIGLQAKTAVEALAQLLKDPDETVRRHTVQAIAGIRPGPHVMVPLCIELLQDPDPAVRLRVMTAIANVGARAVPALIAALDNDKAAYWACVVLRDIGPAAKDAVPALTKKLQHKDPEIRREAILALGAMEAAATSAVGPIAAAVKDENTCGAATFALGRIGQIPSDILPTIQANAKSDDKVLSIASLWALARVHPEDKELFRQVAEQLIPRLKDPNELVRKTAANAMLSLPPAPEIAMPIWEKTFQNADDATIRHALAALSAQGAPAVPRLVAALKNQKARGYVIFALGEMGKTAAPATEALGVLVDDKDPIIAQEASIALAKIGPAAKDAVPALTKVLAGGDGSRIPAAAYALGRIGPDAKAAVPALRATLKSKEDVSAEAAAWALTQIEPRSAEIVTEVLPVLVNALSSPQAHVRQGAAVALGGIGARTDAARKALQKAASSDEDPAVREAAAKALNPDAGARPLRKSILRRRR
jgi:HEAT repeat protein